MAREGEQSLRSETPGQDGHMDVSDVNWVFRLGPEPAGGWKVDSFWANIYSPARGYRVEAYANQHGAGEGRGKLTRRVPSRP